MVPKIQTERQARALADVPKDKRPEVLKEAEKSGKLTARSITEAAEKIKAPEVISGAVLAGSTMNHPTASADLRRSTKSSKNRPHDKRREKSPAGQNE
jgi:hypothetical protein